MKKINYSNSSVAIYCLSVCFFMLTACQPEESIETNVTSDKSSQTLARAGDCNSECIVPGGPYFENSESKVINWGNRTKTIEVKYYNTETHFVVMAKSTNGWADLLKNSVSVWTAGSVAANTWATYSYPLPSGWEACDLESFVLEVAGNGPPAKFVVDYNLIGVCNDGCETEFTGDVLASGDTKEAVYTFTANSDYDYIKIQGGLTNFVGTNAIVTVTGGNLEVSQSTPGGSTNRIIKIKGSVSECEKITIHVTWNSINTDGIITGDWSVKNRLGSDITHPVNALRSN
ncbi:hypothetical protein [Flavobacterium pedocola]